MYRPAHVPSARRKPCRRRPGSCRPCRAGRTTAAPRPTDLVPFLGNAEGSKTSTRVGLAQLLADLVGQGREQRLVVPGHLADELLQALAFLVVEVGDPLAGLVLELGEQSGHVLGGMPPLLGLVERRRERLDEGLEPVSRPCIISGETSAWASISSSRTSYRRSMIDPQPG